MAYIPRPTRFDLNVPLSFETEGGTQYGHCVNASESGMLAVFDKRVELFTRGKISMLVGDFYVSIRASVARTQGLDAGMAFLIETHNDRMTVRILLDLAVARLQPPREEGTP